jgi:hypothetical protein
MNPSRLAETLAKTREARAALERIGRGGLSDERAEWLRALERVRPLPMDPTVRYLLELLEETLSRGGLK